MIAPLLLSEKFLESQKILLIVIASAPLKMPASSLSCSADRYLYESL